MSTRRSANCLWLSGVAIACLVATGAAVSTVDSASASGGQVYPDEYRTAWAQIVVDQFDRWPGQTTLTRGRIRGSLLTGGGRGGSFEAAHPREQPHY